MTKSQLRCQIYVSQGQGGSRAGPGGGGGGGGARHPPPPPPTPPLFLDQTEARRAEKKTFGDCPLPLSEGLDLLLQALYQKLQRTKN